MATTIGRQHWINIIIGYHFECFVTGVSDVILKIGSIGLHTCTGIKVFSLSVELESNYIIGIIFLDAPPRPSVVKKGSLP